MTPRTDTTRRGWLLLLKSVIFTALALALVVYTGLVVRPARAGNAFGGPWPSFVKQKPETIDVMFFGTSHAFTAVDPSQIWRATGVPSFVLAGAVQRMQLTKYYVLESLRTQKPKVVAIELVSMSYKEGKFDANFHSTNVNYMPLTENRLKAVMFETPWGEKTGLILDIWAHHNRWTKVKKADFDVLHKDDGYEYLRGHIPLAGVFKSIPTTPAAGITQPLPSAAAKTVAFNITALREIAEECEKRDIEMLVFVAPTGPPGAYSGYLRETRRLMEKDHPEVAFADFSLPGAVPGISYETDFYDGGHLNHIGAEKFGAFLGKYLSESYDLPDRKSDARYASWDDDAKLRDGYVEEQEERTAKKRKPSTKVP